VRFGAGLLWLMVRTNYGFFSKNQLNLKLSERRKMSDQLSENHFLKKGKISRQFPVLHAL
jgi:hypothetical protein